MKVLYYSQNSYLKIPLPIYEMSKKTKVIGRKSKIYTNHNNIILEPVNKEWKEITVSSFNEKGIH